jgi:hypothetical protein
MIHISHRGNIDGRQAERENREDYITEALSAGYHVEIDVWYNNSWWLGHDGPEYKTSSAFLDQANLWIHCKNIDALCLAAATWNCFWHQEDNYTITTQGYIWAYPGKPVTYGSKSIAVMPEWQNTSTFNFAGVCSDYIERYKNETSTI